MVSKSFPVVVFLGQNNVYVFNDWEFIVNIYIYLEMIYSCKLVK